MSDSNDCYLCRTPAKVQTLGRLGELECVRCPQCGLYCMTEEALDHLSAFDDNKKACIAAFVLERNLRQKSEAITLTFEKMEKDGPEDKKIYIPLDRVLAEFPLPEVSERLDRALLNISLLSKHPGFKISVTDFSAPLVYAENTKALLFLLEQLRAEGFIECVVQLPTEIHLTAKGWNRVAELEKKHLGVENRQAFVAMWFCPETEQAYHEGILPAINDAGFRAMRIDFKEHNNSITDEIIAEIRRSRFLIAEMTGHRQGVYYEAGFMHGLGRSVIFACRKKEIEQAHFDTRQYNHIVWEQPSDLRKLLYNRIRATIV